MWGSVGRNKSFVAGPPQGLKGGDKLLLIPLQLAPSPMLFIALWIEHALNVAVQRSHDADARKHRRAAERGD